MDVTFSSVLRSILSLTGQVLNFQVIPGFPVWLIGLLLLIFTCDTYTIFDLKPKEDNKSDFSFRRSG